MLGGYFQGARDPSGRRIFIIEVFVVAFLCPFFLMSYGHEGSNFGYDCSDYDHDCYVRSYFFIIRAIVIIIIIIII